MELNGRLAWVTGASSGIGRAVALALAQARAQLTFVNGFANVNVRRSLGELGPTFAENKRDNIQAQIGFRGEITPAISWDAYYQYGRSKESITVKGDGLKASFAEVEQQFAMQATFYDCSAPMKVMILVSKFDHCFLNLLYRHHKGELDFQITAVVSNHLDLRPIAEREGLRFIYLPVTKETKAQQEQELLKF